MKKKTFTRLLLTVILISSVSLFLSSCGQKRIVFIDSTEDILGFVEDGKIISTTVIKDGVIVTRGFIVKFREMKKALEEK
jgi:hypothetical protein